MKSVEIAYVLERAERRWFSGNLRSRFPDGERSDWKARFMARACTLFAFWSRPRPVAPPAPADRVTADELAEVARLTGEIALVLSVTKGGSGRAEIERMAVLLSKLAAEVTALRAERDAWKALAHAERDVRTAAHHGDKHADFEAKRDVARASGTLRALGIDPAAREP